MGFFSTIGSLVGTAIGGPAGGAVGGGLGGFLDSQGSDKGGSQGVSGANPSAYNPTMDSAFAFGPRPDDSGGLAGMVKDNISAVRNNPLGSWADSTINATSGSLGLASLSNAMGPSSFGRGGQRGTFGSEYDFERLPTDEVMGGQRFDPLDYGTAEYAEGGLINGSGGGLDDLVQANIEGSQAARLSDGEFVVPADVVSALGDGSTNAGAKSLYQLIKDVRKAKNMAQEPTPLDEGLNTLREASLRGR